MDVMMPGQGCHDASMAHATRPRGKQPESLLRRVSSSHGAVPSIRAMDTADQVRTAPWVASPPIVRRTMHPTGGAPVAPQACTISDAGPGGSRTEVFVMTGPGYGSRTLSAYRPVASIEGLPRGDACKATPRADLAAQTSRGGSFARTTRSPPLLSTPS